MPSERDPTVSRIELVGKWFAVLGAVCYATGFLVVYTFAGRFQIRDHGGELFKLKYAYVEILCWLFPAGVLLPTWAFIFLHKSFEESRSPKKELTAKEVFKSFRFIAWYSSHSKPEEKTDILTFLLTVVVVD